MNCEQLIDIDDHCLGNSGGLLKVIYQDESEVTIGYTVDQMEVDTVTTAKRFRNLPMKRGRGGFTDTPTIDQNTGVSAFTGTLTVRLPRRRQEVINAIKLMGLGQRRMTIAYQDGNKKYWLIPSGWLSSAAGNTGENLPDANLEEIQFTTEGEWIERGYEITEAQFLALIDYVEPEIADITPDSSSVGDTVVFTGGGFTGATAIDWGGTAGVTFTVVSDTVISAVVPVGATGVIDVTVTTPEGTSLPFSFTVV